LLQIEKELSNEIPKISNLDKLLKSLLEKLQNLSRIWASSNFVRRQTLQKILFPEGILFDAKNPQYLTHEANLFLDLMYRISSDYEANKKTTSQFF
jgi:site-specific DNA recombinase